MLLDGCATSVKMIPALVRNPDNWARRGLASLMYWKEKHFLAEIHSRYLEAGTHSCAAWMLISLPHLPIDFLLPLKPTPSRIVLGRGPQLQSPATRNLYSAANSGQAIAAVVPSSKGG